MIPASLAQVLLLRKGGSVALIGNLAGAYGAATFNT